MPDNDKITVKVTFSGIDPFDAEVIPVLKGQKKKAGFIRTAVFCYVKGLNSRNGEAAAEKPRLAEEDLKLGKKISKLEDLDF